jgi:hypothetical protein
MIRNLVVVSDTHIGDQLALCSPTARLDSGNEYRAVAKVARLLWAWWNEFWCWVSEATDHEPFAVVVNGDAIEGKHHETTHQWSHNPEDQKAEAVKIFKPIVELCEGRFYMVRGTEAHVGKSAEREENLAKALGAIPNEDGQYSRYEMWVRVGSKLAHLSHHIGTAGSMAYESSAIMRELSEAYVQAGRWGDEPPTWVVRSHRHTSLQIIIPSEDTNAISLTTPAWQLKTPFVHKTAGGRQARPQIGGVFLRDGNEVPYARHWTRSVARPNEVILGQCKAEIVTL